jgi:hypothetical protein
MEPTRKEMLSLAEYLKGYGDAVKNEQLIKAAEYLKDAGKHLCAQGIYGCHGGERCTSDHK